MNSWIISYSAESTGLKLEELKLHNNHPKVEEITISTDASCKLIIAEIMFKNICNKEEAIEIGDKLINVLFDQIAIDHSIPVGIAEQFSCKNKIQQEGDHFDLCILPLSFTACGRSIYTPSEDQLNTLKDRVGNLSIERNINLQLYRSCIFQKDPIAKFMFLYNLLLVIAGDDQKEVEKIITKYEHNIEKKEHTREWKGKIITTTETVYTRLRNEIAHKRKECFPEKTKSEIDFYINNFQGIVRKAVLEEICPEHR